MENQLKTLETLLASYEIQHVAGEIDEDIYEREISLLTTGLETTKNELNTIKQVTNHFLLQQHQQLPSQLWHDSEVAPAVEAAPAPVIVEAPTIETVAEPAPIEPTI